MMNMITPAAVQSKPATLIRGPNLATFIKNPPGLPFVESFMKASTERRVAASSQSLDGVLVGSDAWKPLAEAFTSWTGTLVCYVEPGTAFNKSRMFSRQDNAIVYKDPGSEQLWRFDVPIAYLGASDAILVAEHPSYSLSVVDGCVQVKVVGFPDILFGLPANTGWYLTEAEHGIPVGAGDDRSNQLARFLTRGAGGKICPVARSCGNTESRYVNLNFSPSHALGMVVEAQ